MNSLVRPYEAEDRAAVRKIFLATADAGRPLGDAFPNPELLADLWTEPYLRYAPETVWVAEVDGQVAGYLMATFDEHTFHQRLKQHIPAQLWRAVEQGILWHRSLWRLAWLNRSLILPQGCKG